MKREPGLPLYSWSRVVGCTRDEGAETAFRCYREFQLVPPAPVMLRFSSDFLVVLGKCSL